MSPDWCYDTPPDLDALYKIALIAYDAMPTQFRKLCGNLVIHVAEEAEPDLLRDLEIDDPLELSGLFEGVGLPDASVTDPLPEPNHVHLYRRAIIAEWRESRGITLQQLVAHVLVHEVGHHFGLSDEDMHAIEEKAG